MKRGERPTAAGLNRLMRSIDQRLDMAEREIDQLLEHQARRGPAQIS